MILLFHWYQYIGPQAKRFEILHMTITTTERVRVPEGYTVPIGCNCIRLKKALYGLKQAPRAWNKDINEKLHSLGFTKLQSEPCLYLSTRTMTFVLSHCMLMTWSLLLHPWLSLVM